MGVVVVGVVLGMVLVSANGRGCGTLVTGATVAVGLEGLCPVE